MGVNSVLIRNEFLSSRTDNRHNKDFEERNPGLSGRSGIVCRIDLDSRAGAYSQALPCPGGSQGREWGAALLA